MADLLERENDAVAFRVRLLVDADLTVNHRHNTVTELLMDEGLNGRSVDEHTLKWSSSHNVPRGGDEGHVPQRDDKAEGLGEVPGRDHGAGTSSHRSQR